MKRFLVVFFVILVLIFGGTYFVLRYLANDFVEGVVVSGAEQYLGRQLVFHDGVHVSFVPLVIEARHVSLLNPKTLNDDDMLSIKRLSVKLSFFGLFQERKLVLKKIIVESPDVRLFRRANGQRNWLLVTREAPMLKKMSVALKAQERRSKKSPFLLEINQIVIKDGRFSYDDGLTGVSTELQDVQFSGSVKSFQDASVSTSMNVLYQGNTYPVSFSGRGGIDSANVLMFEDSEFSVYDYTVLVPFVTVSLQGDKPSIKASLSSRFLDEGLFEVLSGQSEANIQAESLRKQSAATPFSWDRKPLDFSFLSSVNLDLDLYLDRMNVGQFSLEKMHVKFLMQHDRLSVNAPDFRLAEGNARFSMTLIPQIEDSVLASVSYGFDGTNLAHLEKTTIGKVMSSGLLNGSGDLRFSGSSIDQWMHSLQGEGNLALTQGQLRGANVGHVFQKIPGTHMFDIGEGDTAVSDVKAGYTIHNGRLSNNDLNVSLGAVHVKGKGDIDLANLRVDYRLTPGVMVDAGAGQQEALYVPIDIRGPFSKLTYQPAITALLPNAAVEKNLKKLMSSPQDAKEILRDVRKGFKGDVRGLGDKLESVGKGLLKQNKEIQNLNKLLEGF